MKRTKKKDAVSLLVGLTTEQARDVQALINRARELMTDIDLATDTDVSDSFAVSVTRVHRALDKMEAEIARSIRD